MPILSTAGLAMRLTIQDPEGTRVVELPPSVATFGRSSECTFRLADRELSRVHFQIEPVSQGGFKLVDLESRNGTRVNGRGANQHLLSAGDRIQAGKTTIVFGEAAPPPAEGVPVAQVVDRAAEPAPAAPRGDRRSSTTSRIEKPRPAADPAPRLRRDESPVRVVGWIAGVLFAAIAILIVASSFTGESEAQRAGRGAYERAFRLEKPDPQGALALYRTIPPAAGPWHRKAQERADLLQAHVDAGPETDPEERAALDTLEALRGAGPSRAEDLISRGEAFKARYPSSRHALQVDEWIRETREQRAALRRRDSQAVIEESRAAAAREEFGRARALLNGARARFDADLELRKALDDACRGIDVEAGAHAEAKLGEADRLQAQGRRSDALLLLERLRHDLGNGTVPEFEDRVKLIRLKEQAIAR